MSDVHDLPASSTARPRLRFPVVGIGASAGGLRAFQEFLDGMPADAGLALVILSHLEPTRESHLPAILARSTPMPVVEALDGVEVSPGHVYVIPPGRFLRIADGRLRLADPVPTGAVKLPIDYFLRSLAEDCQELSIGVILSGAGSDGAQGLRAIREVGGMGIAQDPATAEHDSMPRAAIATGLVDHVLPIARMAESILGFARHPYVRAVQAGSGETAEGRDELGAILALVLARTRSDFRTYRKPMIHRRIERRMGLAGLPTVAAYLARLREDPKEVHLLARDLLIGVTSFFREPEAFDELRTRVIAPLVAERAGDATIRVWVPACSTGEEAYSLAMLFLEEIGAAGRNVWLQLFATDVGVDALDAARAGVYPESIAADVSPARLARFFRREGGWFRVSKELRASVVFAVQNVIAHPAFSRLDLVSCRNLLIYLEPETQARVVSMLHFALNPGGHLFVGKSDGIGRHSEAFETVSKKARIYRALPSGRAVSGLPVLPALTADLPGHWATIPAPVRKPELSNAVDLALKAFLGHFDAVVLLVDRLGTLLYSQGAVSQVLEVPAGEPDHNVFTMVRGKSGGRLRPAIRQALLENRPVRIEHLRLATGKEFAQVTVTVHPVPDADSKPSLAAVVFQKPQASDAPAAAGRSEGPDLGDQELVLEQLETELRTIRDDLQATVEQSETANEELKAANEEVMSMNEELQSTNEELETSKEELQSLNEELTTANAQIQEKLDELTEANNDLANLLASTEQATIFLDTRLRVKRFTPGATKLLSLIPSDIDRPIADLAQNFVGEGLAEHAEVVLRDLVPREREIRTKDGKVYLMRVLLYRTLDKRVDGVVITFADISRVRLADAEARAARAFAEAIVETVRDPLLVLDPALSVVTVNRAFVGMFGGSLEGLRGRTLTTLGPGFCNEPRLVEALRAVAELDQPFEDLELAFDARTRPSRTLRLNGRRVLRTDDGAPLILLAIEDVSERRKADEAIRESEERYRQLFEAVSDAVLVMDGKTRRMVDVNMAASKMYGYTREEFLGLTHWDIAAESRKTDPSNRRPPVHGDLRARLRWHRKKDGTVFPVEIALGTFVLNGRPVACGVIRDVTERKEAEENRLEQEERLHRLTARLATAQDQEQRRIAEGLHDDVAQLLTAASLTLATVRVTVGPGGGNPALDEADRLIQEANERIHGLTFELASSTLYRLGLAQAVEELCESLRQRVGIQFRVRDQTGGLPLEPVTAIVLLRGCANCSSTS